MAYFACIGVILSALGVACYLSWRAKCAALPDDYTEDFKDAGSP